MVDAIATAEANPLCTDEEKAVIAGATELARDARLSPEAFERLRTFFDERGLVELVINTAVGGLNNRITDSFVADIELD